MISQCMTEKEQFKLMQVTIDLRRIMVLSQYDQVQTSRRNMVRTGGGGGGGGVTRNIVGTHACPKKKKSKKGLFSDLRRRQRLFFLYVFYCIRSA